MSETTSETTLAAIYDELTAPFPVELVEIRPGATTRDGSRALALAYVDLRAYQQRLDEVIGPDGWAVQYRQLGQRAIVCTLTILGVVREDVGEPSSDDTNPACSAVAQAFKRTCSAFGLGRYLYALPLVWGEYDAEKRQFKDADKVKYDMYSRAGLVRRNGGAR